MKAVRLPPYISALTSVQDQFQDPDEIEFKLQMSKTIEGIPAELRDRFKALKVLHDQGALIDDEEEVIYRQIEVKYDKLYKEVYEQRRKVLAGEISPPENLLAEFATRAIELDDEEYKKLEVDPCDVKDIQNTPLGVYGFWMRAMLNHPNISALIQEKDRPIMMHLLDISYDLHEVGYGFDLTFKFEKNDYFSNEFLKKVFVMTKQNVIEECKGTVITWKDGKDVTKKKIKKKKGKKPVNKTVDVESFFNFFKTISLDAETVDKTEKEGDESEKDLGEKMDADFDLGNDFKDQLIPLGLEYYLEVIEDDEEGCDDDECEDDHHGHGGGKGDDSDSDEGAKGGKKKKATGKEKKDAKKDAAAAQQECKQQ